MQTRSSNQRVVQTTLDQYEIGAGAESEYDHLVSHLIEKEDDKLVPSQWTRVFSRDGPADKKVGIYKLGEDLIFDKSVRQVLQQN